MTAASRFLDVIPAPTVPFATVFDLRLLNRLPLDIGRIISPATLKRHDVIHDIAPSAIRITRALHEVGSCRGTALDFPVAAPFGDSAANRC